MHLVREQQRHAELHRLRHVVREAAGAGAGGPRASVEVDNEGHRVGHLYRVACHLELEPLGGAQLVHQLGGARIVRAATAVNGDGARWQAPSVATDEDRWEVAAIKCSSGALQPAEDVKAMARRGGRLQRPRQCVSPPVALALRRRGAEAPRNTLSSGTQEVHSRGAFSGATDGNSLQGG